jgi:HPt (histidine-containing phosphotransfer) domain-containing protein
VSSLQLEGQMNAPFSRRARVVRLTLRFPAHPTLRAMTAVLDLAQLETMTGSDAALAAEALGIFRQSAELWSRMLDPATDAEHWADAAHAIKGAARSVGAMDLGDACETAERLGRSGNVSNVAAGVAISTVKDRLGEALEAIAHVEHQLTMRRTFVGVRLG